MFQDFPTGLEAFTTCHAGDIPKYAGKFRRSLGYPLHKVPFNANSMNFTQLHITSGHEFLQLLDVKYCDIIKQLPAFSAHF